MQDAFATALERWPRDGTPTNPGAWIVTTARNRAIDRLRRERTFVAQGRAARPARGAAGRGRRRELDPRRPARARLHLLPPRARGRGAGRADAARGRRPDDDRDRARVPRRRADDGAAPRAGQEEDPRRRDPLPRAARPPAAGAAAARCSRSSTSSSTRATRPAAAARTIRDELCDEAIRLAKLLAVLMPDEPEALGLLALMLLHDARRDARLGADGELVLLEDQDRGRWDGRGSTRARACSSARSRSGARRRTSCRRRSPRCTSRTPDRLAADRGALRRAGAARAVAGRRAQPRGRRGDGRRARARRSSSSSRSTSRATTCSTRPERTCCAGSSAATRRPRRTGTHSRSR